MKKISMNGTFGEDGGKQQIQGRHRTQQGGEDIKDRSTREDHRRCPIATSLEQPLLTDRPTDELAERQEEDIYYRLEYTI